MRFNTRFNKDQNLEKLFCVFSPWPPGRGTPSNQNMVRQAMLCVDIKYVLDTLLQQGITSIFYVDMPKKVIFL